MDSRNTYVRAVAGVEPEDFLTIAHRYVTVSESRRTAGNLIRQVWDFVLTELVLMPLSPSSSGAEAKRKAAMRSTHVTGDRDAIDALRAAFRVR